METKEKDKIAKDLKAKISESVGKRIKELRDTVEKLMKEVDAWKSKYATECWAGIEKCPFQSTGRLFLVSAHICKDCSELRFNKEALFEQLCIIFEEEINRLIEENVEEYEAAVIEEQIKAIKKEVEEFIQNELGDDDYAQAE